MSDECETLIRVFEGLKLTAYQDSIGVITIGYGHTGPDVKKDMKITVNQAETYLTYDIGKAQALIKQYIKAPLNVNQLGALTSLVFNLGSAPLKGTLGKLLNNGNYQGAVEQFAKWVYAGAEILPGLVRRRAAEQKLFLTPTDER